MVRDAVPQPELLKVRVLCEGKPRQQNRGAVPRQQSMPKVSWTSTSTHCESKRHSRVSGS